MPSTLNLAHVRQLIDAKYGSVAAFAKACGMSRQYMYLIVTGVHDPSLERAVQFAELLGVCLDELVVRRPGTAEGAGDDAGA